MALQRAKVSEIPTDAVRLSEQEALEHQLTTIQDWPKTRDTWPFKYGFTILSSMSALSAIYFNNHYRVRLRLQSYGRASSYLPVVVIPSIVSALFHQQFVVTDVLLQKSCPVCLQVRAASMQTVLGVVFPAILAPLAALPFAIRYLTYNVPPITREPKKVYNMMYRHTKPIFNVFLGLLAAHGLAAALLTHQETKAFINIQQQLNEMERNFEWEQIS